MPDSPSVRWIKQSRKEVGQVATAVLLVSLVGAILVPAYWVLFAVAGGLILLLSIHTIVQHTRILRQMQIRNL